MRRCACSGDLGSRVPRKLPGQQHQDCPGLAYVRPSRQCFKVSRAPPYLDTGQSGTHVVADTVLVGCRCSWALVAQFYPKKYPANIPVLVLCLVAYGICTAVLNLYSMYRAGDSFFFATPQQVHCSSPMHGGMVSILRLLSSHAGLRIVRPQGGYGGELRLSSSLPRYSHIYKLTIHSADLAAAKWCGYACAARIVMFANVPCPFGLMTGRMCFAANRSLWRKM